MRLARFHHNAADWIGAVDGEEIVDLHAANPSIPSDMVELLDGGAAVLSSIERALSSGPRIPLADVQLLAPIARPPKFLAAGMNYAAHVTEMGRTAPTFPVFFNKQSTCVIGPGAPIHKPRASDMIDYEGELGIVIGRRCRHVPADRAHEVVAGYTVVNDVTVRDWQMWSPTMTIGKSFDTHGPIGPWIVTADEVPDPHDLQLRTWVNDELVQDASTGGMIFDCWSQIETLSTAFTLEPGDVISTGTPSGVGMGRDPQVWLKAGDTVRVDIEGIGTLENPVIAEPDDTAVI